MQFIGQAAFIAAAILAITWSQYRPVAFGLFIVATGSLRFGGRLGVGGLNDLAALWILVLILGCVIIMVRQTPRFKLESTPVSIYIIFLLWAVLTCFISGPFVYGVRMLQKLSYPLLAMLVVARVICRSRDVWRMGNVGVAVSCISASMCGGIPQVLLPSYCWGMASMGIVWSYAGMSDHLAIMGVICIALWVRLRNIRIGMAMVFIAISTVLMGNRTGIGALFLGGVALAISQRKLKIIAILVPSFTAMLIVGLLILPGMMEHMFFEGDQMKASEVLANPSAISLDQVNTSGRDLLWSTLLDRLFWSFPIAGSGLGSTQEFLYGPDSTLVASQAHSSYVELMCDTGVVGVALYVAVYLSAMGMAVRRLRSKIPAVAFCASVVVSTVPAVLVVMGFDAATVCGAAVLQYPLVFTAAMVAVETQELQLITPRRRSLLRGGFLSRRDGSGAGLKRRL